jgi:Zn-dependent peptidase ImmA (M78 family)
MEQRYSLKKTAEAASVSEITLRRAIKRGDLKAQRYCGRYFLTASALENWKESQKAPRGGRP